MVKVAGFVNHRLSSAQNFFGVVHLNTFTLTKATGAPTPVLRRTGIKNPFKSLNKQKVYHCRVGR
ncbi:hypothetical protein A4R26_25875 [Niastella populi]|uniref:Uncharacterized protein n=1 Tax=Niastella populi TaxID=550983 RepID=A0A1V9FD75_9BACT|nr:hypothetical protein A4R26_25875 [Niastella populi]